MTAKSQSSRRERLRKWVTKKFLFWMVVFRLWARAGYPTERGLESCLVEPNDVVLSPSVKGDKEAMRRYLEWEIKLTQ